MGWLQNIGAVIVNSGTWLPRGILTSAGKGDIAAKITIPVTGTTQTETNNLDQEYFGTRLIIGGAAVGAGGLAGSANETTEVASNTNSVVNTDTVKGLFTKDKFDTKNLFSLLENYGLEGIGDLINNDSAVIPNTTIPNNSGNFKTGNDSILTKPLFVLFGQPVSLIGLSAIIGAIFLIRKNLK